MNTVAKNSVHLAEGAACPPLQAGLLRIYSMFFCPYAQRTRIVLNFKNVNHEVVNVNLKKKPDWLFKLNPLGKVPILQFGKKVMIESLITCDYLNEAYPDPPLYPSDPWDKGAEQGLIEIFNSKVCSRFNKLYYKSFDSEELEALAEVLQKGLRIFEEELKRRGTKFFFGNRPGMLDYCMFPWFERFSLAQKTFQNFDILNKDRFPTLDAYSLHMHQDEAAKSTVIPVEDQMKFLESFKAGTPDYDLGC